MSFPMYDRELDGLITRDEPAAAPALPSGPVLPSLWNVLPRWPIPRFAQAVFAEAFREGLHERLAADHAVRLAAEVNPSRRFRPILGRMAANIRAGYPLDVALERTGAIVRPGLLAALRVGQEHGNVVEELKAFAARIGRLSPESYARAIGRSREAKVFAAALARLLREERLTVKVVASAGEVAADGEARFLRVIRDVARDMENNGSSLVGALRDHSQDFDPLYCGLLEAANSRAEMRECLERLGL